MSSQFKTINQNNAGTSTKFGGDDLDKTHKWLNGQVGYDPVVLRSSLGVEDGKFFLEYPATGKRVYIRTGALANDEDWWLPIGTGWVTNNLKNLFMNEQAFEKFITFKKIAVPANPDANHITLWADSTTGQIMVKDSTGVAQTIFADISEIANLGSTGVSVYDSKVSTTVYLRSINSLSDAITVASNDTTNSIDFDLDPSEILLETLGGTLLSSQVPSISTANLPSAVVLDSESSTFTGTNKFDKEMVLKQLAAHPTAPAGYVTLYAKDDNNMYYKNSSGSLFKLLYNTDLDTTVPLPEAGYISGYWSGTGVSGTGLLNDLTSLADETVIDYHDLTTGKYGQQWGMNESATGTAVGLLSNRTNLCYRDANPTFTLNFIVDVSTASSATQVFLGLANVGNSESTWDDTSPVATNSKDCFMLAKRAADTSWQIMRNSGDASVTFDNNGLPTLDAQPHKLTIYGDNENDRWGLQFDAGSIIWKSDDDPIEERDLGVACIMNNAVGSSSVLRKLILLDMTLKRKKY